MKYFGLHNIIFACVLTTSFHAQIDDEFQKKFEAANQFTDQKQYEVAKDLWIELAQQYPDNANLNYKTGYCLLNTFFQKREALDYLTKAEKNIQKKYSPIDYTITSAPIETHYYLARAYHHNYQIDSAIKYYRYFQNEGGRNHWLQSKIANALKQCNIAITLISHKKDYEMVNLGDEVNSDFADYNPCLTLDENTLFFTSKRTRTDKESVLNNDIFNPQDGQHFEDIYVSYKDIKNNTFTKRDLITNLEKRIVLKEGVIKSSLYKSATKENISPNIIIEFARLYGFQVDFQRDIRKNDSFQIIYEVFVDENGKIFENGNIIYANLILRGQYNQLYYFPKKNFNGHYDENGKSVKKALMKTPINGARLSSSFGMRKHPILGYNKMHRGTDFAAPEGTPIMASGDGVIVKAGWCGGGGNCVKIKHNKTYQTIYAHMKNFSNLAVPGNRVKQGQIIGYVGSTGLSTGPHLHYEVIENGKKINSQLLKLPPGKSLEGIDRKQFEIVRIKTDVLKSDLIASF